MNRAFQQLYVLLNPLSWVFIGLLLALAFARWRRSFIVLSIGMLLIFSNQWFYYTVAKGWEDAIAPNQRPEALKYAVVLGGGIVDYQEKDSATNYGHSVDRALRAWQMIQRGRVAKAILSGGRNDRNHPDYNNFEWMLKDLKELGLNKANWIIEGKARNTRENAVYCKQLLDSLEGPAAHSVFLITSTLHGKRAQGCFEQVGLRPFLVLTDQVDSEVYAKQPWYEVLKPDFELLNRWRELLKEICGYYGYRLLGYC